MANREGREEIKVAGVPEPISHYCPVVRAGWMEYISGMEPKDENGNAVGKGDVTVHENLKSALPRPAPHLPMFAR